MTDEGMGIEKAPADWTRGMPAGHHGVFTPMGELEQVGKLADGLVRMTGWRRAVVRLAVLAILVLLVASLIGGIISTLA
jgi:hypothetical protein